MKTISDLLQEFIKTKYSFYVTKYEDLEVLRREFISNFPKNQLYNMDIDDYVVGNGKKSFCYWLETKISELGSIKGGSTADKKFGVYFNKEEGEYKTISKWDTDLDSNKAFLKIKQALSELLIASENDDTQMIQKTLFRQCLRTKFLQHITLINI